MFIPFPDLKRRFGVPWCRVHLNRKIARGEFPAPVHLSSQTVAWLEQDIIDYIQRLCTERDARRTRAAVGAAEGNDARAP